MKPQIKRSNYCHFPKHTAPFAIVCALGMLQFASPVTMTCAIADPVVEGSAVTPNADGNPFPNVITPDEVKELQNKTTSSHPPRTITKVFYTTFGKELNIVNGKAAGDTHEISFNSIVHHQDRIGRIDVYMFIPRAKGASYAYADIFPYKSIREFKNADGTLSFDNQKSPQTVMPYSLDVNGKLYGKDLSTKSIVDYPMGEQQTFIHMSTNVRKEDELIWGQAEVRYETAPRICVAFWMLQQCGGAFHFVDDLKYRKTTNISGASVIPQRSAAEPDGFSAKPFTPLNIPDLVEAKTVDKILFLNNNEFTPYFASLVTFKGDPHSVKRPTMEELTGTNIPGYLYYSNDIDTPKGGKFTKDNTENFGNYDYGIARDKDDNQLTTKHYYVTFRPIPTQLVVQYKNTDGALEVGKPYELYAAEKQIPGDFKSVKEATALTKAELEALIKDKNTTLLSDAAGYVSKGLAYLAPGTYTVKPTAKAPDGYEWVVETTGSEQKSQADVTVAKQINVGDPTQQVVTFVLKKKAGDEKQEPKVSPLYRLYNPYTHEHFFTAETTENDNLVRLGWKSEGGVGYIYKHAEKGGVYRLYNPTTGEHHYTMNEGEVATCVKAGWKNEGVKWFSAQDKEVTLNKLYSMYNPYEKKFYHHYTADAKEIEQMVKAGWRKEEVKWCTLPVSYIIKK